MNAFGKELLDIRTRYELSPSKFAAKLGFGSKFLYKISADREYIPYDIVDRLKAHFVVDELHLRTLLAQMRGQTIMKVPDIYADAELIAAFSIKFETLNNADKDKLAALLL